MARDGRKRVIFKSFFAVQATQKNPTGKGKPRYRWVFVPEGAEVMDVLSKRPDWQMSDPPIELYCEARASVEDGQKTETVEAGPTRKESGIPPHARNGLAMALSYYLRASVCLLYTDLDNRSTRHQIEVVEETEEVEEADKSQEGLSEQRLSI